MSTPSFNVAVVGPSRVGKTTLLTAILADTEDLLAGSDVQVSLDEITANRVRRQQKALRSALQLGAFDAAALSGNQEIARYEVKLQSRVLESVEMPFRMLDYPGGWLDPERRAVNPEVAKFWVECDLHMKNSVMLLVPIDAAVLMEAITPKQRVAAEELLATYDVEAIARRWASTRNLDEHRDEPAVLVLAPLKCEKYFDDNGGTAKDAERLKSRVKEVYQNLLDIVDKETPHREVRVVYAPIDTYGCVELMEATWPERVDGSLDFVAHYRLRGKHSAISVKAAGAIMQELCRCIVAGWDKVQRQQITAERHARLDIEQNVNKQRGFFSSLWYHFGGDAQVDRKKIITINGRIESVERRRLQLEESVKKLAAAADDPRVEQWS